MKTQPDTILDPPWPRDVVNRAQDVCTQEDSYADQTEYPQEHRDIPATTPTTNTNHTHTHQSSIPQQEQCPSVSQSLCDVGQDKGAAYRASSASSQPAPETNHTRAQALHTERERSHKGYTGHTRTEKVTIWLRARAKAELVRIAEQKRLSISATGAAFLEQALQSSIHEQHGALLETVITQAIGRSMRAYSNRLATLLIRVALDAGQTRALVTNVLGRQPGVTPEVLHTILDGSMQTAKRTLTTRTPQFEELMKEMDAMLIEEKKKDV